MHWQLQPVILVLIIGTLALLAIPRAAHPQEPSAAVRRACDGDVRRLCPKEYRAKDSAAIGTCMRAHWTGISGRCMAAWGSEHPGQK
jgi:hypothetical protein